jgi:hypothetical protein
MNKFFLRCDIVRETAHARKLLLLHEKKILWEIKSCSATDLDLLEIDSWDVRLYDRWKKKKKKQKEAEEEREKNELVVQHVSSQWELRQQF